MEPGQQLCPEVRVVVAGRMVLATESGRWSSAHCVRGRDHEAHEVGPYQMVSQAIRGTARRGGGGSTVVAVCRKLLTS